MVKLEENCCFCCGSVPTCTVRANDDHLTPSMPVQEQKNTCLHADSVEHCCTLDPGQCALMVASWQFFDLKEKKNASRATKQVFELQKGMSPLKAKVIAKFWTAVTCRLCKILTWMRTMADFR